MSFGPASPLTAASRSVKALAVIVKAKLSPEVIARAKLPSWVLVMVKVLVERAITRTISELVGVGIEFDGHTVQLYGTVGAGKLEPSLTTRVVPLAGGVGTTDTVEEDRFL